MGGILLTILAVPVALGARYLAAVGWVHVWELMTEDREDR